MGRYVVRRLFQMVLVLWVVSMITFLLFWASPARPARVICNYHCTEARYAEIDEAYGFADPLAVQYGRYMSGLINPFGRDLGAEGSKEHCAWPCFDRSITTGQQVWELISTAFWPTFWLASGASVLWLVGGVTLGVLAALRRGRMLDRTSVIFALFGVSFPTLVLGYLLMQVFVTRLGVLPYPEMKYAQLTTAGLGPWLTFYLLPWITLAMVFAALYTRLARAQMIDVMSEDFIRTARAKGLSEARVVIKHGLRAALMPIITVFGLDFGGLIGGAVITEQVFSIFGLGKLTLGAVLGNDLPVIMGVVTFTAFFIIAANATVDVLYAFIDPRIRI